LADAGIPPLSTAILEDEDDRLDALKLIADSVAQQRQAASRALIFHPITIVLWAIMLGVTSRLQYKQSDDVGIWLTTVMGLTMAMLVAVRGATGGYLSEAEAIKWEFLENEDGEEDQLIGAKFGAEIIGALALRLERPGGAKKKSKTGGYKGGKGVIRAWTTKLRYRHKGIGTELLEEALRITREKCGRDSEVGFAADHANSKRILPSVFNSNFRRGEEKAIRFLEQVDGDLGKKKR
jgi:ribosomal protein S18 acetylase RimI-like enzyme